MILSLVRFTRIDYSDKLRSMLIERTLRSFVSICLTAIICFGPLSAAAIPVSAQTYSVVPDRLVPLTDLQQKIRARLADPVVRRGNIGIKVVSLSSGKVIFEENAEKYFMPASNMKNFTVAAAIEKLGPDYRYVTRITSRMKPDENGVVNGDLVVRGVGDVSVSYTFNHEDRFKGIDRIVDALMRAGVKKVNGSIIGDDTYFKGSALPTGWEWDDLQWYYGAEVSALPINDNAIELSVMPSSSGLQCSARILPFNFVYRVNNRCMTTPAGTPRTLRIEKRLGENIVDISGDLPMGNAGFRNNITVSRPAEMYASMLKQRLAEKGIEVSGQGRAIQKMESVAASTLNEIASIESPPLALIAAKTMKPSQNMYTEVLLWTLGEEERKVALIPPGQEPSSAQLGITSVKNITKQMGLAEDSFMQYDGSGLSRHNIVSPDAVTRLYVYMAKQSRHSRAWMDSLTIGGVDGTLRNRFRGTSGEKNVRGKTGTINQVSALSGYVKTAAGEDLVFSMLVNGVAETRTRVGFIDDTVLMLANFNGKVDQ